MASKDVSIEILEAGANTISGDVLLCNATFNNNSCWVNGAQWNISGGRNIKTQGGSGADLNFEQPFDFQEGFSYRVILVVKLYNRGGTLSLIGHGQGGANIPLFGPSDICSGCDGTNGTYVKFSVDFVQGDQNLNRIKLGVNNLTSMELGYVDLYRTMANPAIVRGRLDASTTDDFPLALTFAVNDPSQIDARKGSYSKTFNIPATKNNNKILKHFNIANSNNLGVVMSERLKCRILVGDLYSLVGLLEIKGVERLNDKPIFYSCVFLGDNLGWSTLLDDKFLSDLQLENSTDLKLSAKNIVKTWQADSCDSSTLIDGTNTVNTSPVVYPVATYGYTNETGFNYGSSMQLLREVWEEDYMDNVAYDVNHTGLAYSYATGLNALGLIFSEKEPVNDWRPMVWIYNMIHKIFNDIGYKISSNFIESSNFKKLLYASPNFLYNNPDDRWQANSYIGNFKDTSCGGSPPTSADLKFFDMTTQITGSNFPNSSGTYSSITPNNFAVSGLGTSTGIPFHNAGGACATCVLGDCGSGRFQPSVGVNVNTATLLQQDLQIDTAGLGTANWPYYSKWVIAEAGYYDITTENIMYYINIGDAASGAWSGGGNLSSNSTGIKNLLGGIRVMTKRVGETNWSYREGVTEDDQSLNGGTFWPCTQSVSSGGTLDTRTFTGYFNKGDTVRLTFGVLIEMDVKNPNNNYTNGKTHVDIQIELIGTRYNNWAASNGKVSIKLAQPEIPVFGGVYNLQDVFSKEQSQLDFVKGVAHSFNLQFSTDEDSRTVTIEPFSDFYLPPADALDWTWKLARNEVDNQSFIETDFARRMIFKYKTDDKDWRVKYMSDNFFQGVGDNYPKIMDLGDLYPKGDSIFENPFFAGTYDSQGMNIAVLDTPGTNFYAAALWEDAWGAKEKGVEYLPRMLYYNKMSMPADHAPLWQGFNVESKGTTNHRFNSRRVQVSDVLAAGQNYYSGNNLDNAFYTSASFVNRYDFTNQFGLSYGNYWAQDYDPSDNSYNAVGDQIGKGLYQRYYSSMISGLLEVPKIRTCYMDLKIADIVQLNFRKMVYIDGVYYRVVKVVDYQPHLNVPTKVILHQFSTAIGVSLPTEGVWINTNNNGGGGINEDGSSTEPVAPPAA